MSLYRLRNDGYDTFKKIMHGRKWVGRVARHATEDRYIGRIGKTCFEALSEIDAFEGVVAKHLGFASANALRSRNAQVRAVGRARRQHQRQLINRFMSADLRGKMDVIDELMGIKK